MLYDQLEEYTQKEQQWLVELPFIQHGLKGNISKQAYITFLSQAYHHVKHTVPLMMACGTNLIDKHRWIQNYMAGYIREEIGHEQWILNDIKASGGDPDAVKNSNPGFACELMVAYAYDMICRVNPFGFLGMIFVLEGTSIKLATKAAKILQDKLGLPKTAFSYLISHGEVDIEHIDFLEELVNKVEGTENQDCIIHCAKRFFNLYGNIFIELEKYLSVPS